MTLKESASEGMTSKMRPRSAARRIDKEHKEQKSKLCLTSKSPARYIEVRIVPLTVHAQRGPSWTTQSDHKKKVFPQLT